jgi:hypothetical protein
MATNQLATTDELFEVVFSVVRAATVATQQIGKQASTTKEELCFLSVPCRRVFNGSRLELNSVGIYVPHGKDVSGQC